MEHSVGYSFDIENRVVYIARWSENENGDITVISENSYANDQWSVMDEDSWLREIPAINAELEANALLAKLRVVA
jgi:hypothetical protein